MIKRASLSVVGLSIVAVVAAFGVLGSASASTVRYSHTWSPSLNLPSNYQPCCPSTAGGSVALFDRRPCCRGGPRACADQMAGLSSLNAVASRNGGAASTASS